MDQEQPNDLSYTPERYLEELSTMFWSEKQDIRDDFRMRVHELVSLDWFRWNTPKFIQLESKKQMILLWNWEFLELWTYVQITVWWYTLVHAKSWIYVFDNKNWKHVKCFPENTDIKYADESYFWKAEWMNSKHGIIVTYYFPRSEWIEFFNEELSVSHWRFESSWFCEFEDIWDIQSFSRWGKRWDSYYLISCSDNTYNEVELWKIEHNTGYYWCFQYANMTLWFDQNWRLGKWITPIKDKNNFDK